MNKEIPSVVAFVDACCSEDAYLILLRRGRAKARKPLLSASPTRGIVCRGTETVQKPKSRVTNSR